MVVHIEMDTSVRSQKRKAHECPGDAVFAIKERRPKQRQTHSESDEDIVDKVGNDSLLIVGKPSMDKKGRIKAMLAAQRKQKLSKTDESILEQAHSVDSSNWLERYIFEWDTYLGWTESNYFEALEQLAENPELIFIFPYCVRKEIVESIFFNKSIEDTILRDFLKNTADEKLRELYRSMITWPYRRSKTFVEEMSAVLGSDHKISSSVKEEIQSLQTSFNKLSEKYQLYNKVGEGTFSSVYLGRLRSKWCDDCLCAHEYRPDAAMKPPLLALKKIYVTSSPQRIYNELELLFQLRGHENVAPLLDVMRWEDQVVAVLPYYQHTDFRDFYRDLPLVGIRSYMHELFKALKFIHEKGIIHRDIKPTNFLYNHLSGRGVLVDFGLAERYVEPITNKCPCMDNETTRFHEYIPFFPKNGYLKDDQRPGKRANRAGTRGFRAPEVLFKCNNQTPLIDIWSAGVILVTLLSRRFPFFNSTDDIEALIELACIYGKDEMKACANLHGLDFESNAPRIQQSLGFKTLIYQSLLIDCKEGDTFAEDSPAWELLAYRHNSEECGDMYKRGYDDAFDLITDCMELNPSKRISAEDVLNSKFFKARKSNRT